MTRRTAVRRSAVLGLGAVGSLLLAAPASALDAGSTVQGVVDQAGVAVVDPLTAPLQGTALEPVEPVVEAAPAPVQQAVGAVTGQQAPAAGEDPKVTPPPTGGGAPAPAETPQQTGAPATTGTPAAQGTAATTAAGGTGVASLPSGFSGSTAGLEGLSGRGAGFGTAMNPMSLFGAPQVASLPQLDTSLPTPLAITPAGGVLADVLPVEAPEGLPAALVAVACTVVAGAVAAHVAALRTRRAAVTA